MDNITKLFCELVKIPSPSGKELEVAKFIKQYLEKKDIRTVLDDTGKRNDSNAGNIIVQLKGAVKLPTYLFVAHMDTVETGERSIVPVINKDLITSDGTTVLGADDKAAVACLLETLEEIKTWQIRPTIIAAFTTREERGKMGSSILNISEKIDYCFNLDGPDELGTFIYQTLGEIPFRIIFEGRAAHAAIEPEKGVNALTTAAIAITRLPIGKDKNGSTLNIGKIIGGTGNNIVPAEVIIEGQIRSFTQQELDAGLKNVRRIVEQVCLETGCKYHFIKQSEEGAPPATLDKNHSIIKIAEKATTTLHRSFSLERGSFTTDSNFLASKYPTLTICFGNKMPHSTKESITIKDLQDSKKLIIEIIKQGMKTYMLELKK